MNILALDFGGSSVKCAVVLEEGIQFLEQFSVPSSATSFQDWVINFEPHFRRIDNLYGGIDGIAISTCGAVDVESSVINGSSALSYIHGLDTRKLFQNHFHVPVEIENDANCAALAEAWLGSGHGCESFCLVVVGTGIGGAVVSKNLISAGHNLHAGEFGFSVLDYEDGKPKVFGHLASTHALVEQSAKALNINPEKLNGVDVFDLYDQGNEVIEGVVRAWSRYLALGLYNIQYHLDPEKIVIGGAISQRHDLIEMIEAQFDLILSDLPFSTVRPKVDRAKFGNAANLLGAVRHFVNRQKTISKILA